MPIRTKYREAIDLLNQLGAKDIKTWEDEGDLKLSAVLKSEHDKNLVINKIQSIDNGATDIEYDLKVE